MGFLPRTGNGGVTGSAASALAGSMIQPVSSKDLYNYQAPKGIEMIENYIYLYHTDTLIVIPTYPASITDAIGVSFTPTQLLSRSAPIFSYTNSGPRVLNVTIPLHRDLMYDVNTGVSNLNIAIDAEEDYVDTIIKQIQAVALPRYAAEEKMVDPPIIAIRFGNDIFCKGVVTGEVQVSYEGPILRTDKYALATLSFGISEIDPYDADSVMQVGSYRGLNLTLERRIYRSSKMSYAGQMPRERGGSSTHNSSSGNQHGGLGGKF